jgi:hypothetical protein
MEVIAPVAKSVGSAIAAGIQEGFAEAMKSSWVAQILSGDQVDFAKARLQKFGLKTAIEYIKDKKRASHKSGLSRVPYNGYQANLHKNERVLTAAEAKAYDEGKGGNNYAFHVTLNGSGSTEKDAERLFELFVRKVEAAGGAGA